MTNNLCPKPDRCGSCGWSHIPYPKQLEQKLADINGSFKLKELDLRVTEIEPSPVTEHYRNRMDFVIDWQGAMGLREKGKWWKVIDYHTCFIADTKIEQLYAVVRSWVKTANLSFYDRKGNSGLLRYAVIRSTTTGESLINVITSQPDGNEVEVLKQLNALQALAKPTTLLWSINSTKTDVSFGDIVKVVHGPGVLQETINDYTYRISPQAFFQTNPQAATRLQTLVKDFALQDADTSQETLLDLYCGSGFFAIALAKEFKRTIGVEMVAEAITDARLNASTNKINAEFHDVKTEDFDWMNLGADVVILDPPRSGMHDRALQDVLVALPKRIVYVSCNYKNFAREMVLLQKDYDVRKMVALDMFPHTPHVELVTLLVRKQKNP
jgi:23S rRNA (uracil1939-C5)-methyltransferase